MGISGLYSELGPAPRVSLSKLAATHFESTGRRLRLAVDASIWSFQIQAGKGGTNPAIRTLYYRLTRLLSLNITPLFIFDGPLRPAIKRNHATHAHLTPALTKSTKALLTLFGFPHHCAPAEAEAECALLQRLGVVDAVLSEDVDTLMFGCGTTLRSWSAVNAGPGGAPTHVSVYERGAVAAASGIDPDGMVLVALMSGGDYDPAGLPRCGIRTAAECARAGLGAELAAVGVGDDVGLAAWRGKLQEALRGGVGGRGGRGVVVPGDWPDAGVWEAYRSPVVSSGEKVERLRGRIRWEGEVDVGGLREMARWAFEWRGVGGAAKFVRTLAPALLARRLAAETAEGVVRAVHGVREHGSTDGMPEMRVSFIPAELVPLDMSAEEKDVVENDDTDAEPDAEGVEDREGEAGAKPKEYDINALERTWVLELFARRAVPEVVAAWESKKSGAKSKTKVPREKVTREKRKTKEKEKEVQKEPSTVGYLNVSKGSSQNILPNPDPDPAPTLAPAPAPAPALASLVEKIRDLQVVEEGREGPADVDVDVDAGSGVQRPKLKPKSKSKPRQRQRGGQKQRQRRESSTEPELPLPLPVTLPVTLPPTTPPRVLSDLTAAFSIITLSSSSPAPSTPCTSFRTITTPPTPPHPSTPARVQTVVITDTPLSPNVTIRRPRGRVQRRLQLQGQAPVLKKPQKPQVELEPEVQKPRRMSGAKPTAKTAKTKAKRVVLRESVGHWEYLDDGWSVREDRRVWEGLEVVDLTAVE